MKFNQLEHKKYINTFLKALAITALMVIILHLEGRINLCACGYIDFWYGIVNGPGDSQHLFDWYSFTHVLHGLVIYFGIWLFDRSKTLSLQTKILIAVSIAAGWEILENSSIVIERYRSATFALNYYGDSIINSIGDVISMSLGFLFAYKMRWYWSIILFVIIELSLAYIIHDNLIFNVIMLIHPIEAIKAWQQSI